MIQKDQPKDIMTRREAADYMGFKYNTLSRWASNKTRNLEYSKIGRAVRYRREELDRFLDQDLIK